MGSSISRTDPLRERYQEISGRRAGGWKPGDPAVAQRAVPWSALALLGLALAARFVIYPYWKTLPMAGDEYYYWPGAQAIAAGRLIPDFLRPPLWGFVLAPMALLSPDPVGGRVLSSLIGCVVVLQVYALATRVFDRRVGVIAGVGYALLPSAVAYSHYLWSETFFTMIALFVTDAFLRWLPERPQRALCLGGLGAGLALLAKEAAVLLFAAMVATVLVARISVRARVWAATVVLFLAPVLIYSAWATGRTGRIVFLGDAPIYNANQVRHGREPWSLTTDQNKQVFVRDLKAASAADYLRGVGREAANLWTPNSFPVYRLLGTDGFGNYRAPGAAVIAYLTVFADVTVMALGLTGLVFAARSLFQVYSVSMLLALQASGAIFLFCSRFRVPFLFVLVIYAASVVARPQALRSRMNNKLLLSLWIVLMVGLALVVALKWSTIGRWG